jgi:hypothetical protein
MHNFLGILASIISTIHWKLTLKKMSQIFYSEHITGKKSRLTNIKEYTYFYLEGTNFRFVGNHMISVTHLISRYLSFP